MPHGLKSPLFRIDDKRAKALRKGDPDLILNVAAPCFVSMMRVLPVSSAAECCSRTEQWPRASTGRYSRLFLVVVVLAARSCTACCQNATPFGCVKFWTAVDRLSLTSCRRRTREHACLMPYKRVGRPFRQESRFAAVGRRERPEVASSPGDPSVAPLRLIHRAFQGPDGGHGVPSQLSVSRPDPSAATGSWLSALRRQAVRDREARPRPQAAKRRAVQRDPC